MGSISPPAFSPSLFISPTPEPTLHHKSASSTSQSQQSTTSNPHMSQQSQAAAAASNPASAIRTRPDSESDALIERPAKRARRSSASLRRSPLAVSAYVNLTVDDDEVRIISRARTVSRNNTVETIDLSTPQTTSRISEGSRALPIEIVEDDISPQPRASGGVTLPSLSEILGRQQEEQIASQTKPSEKLPGLTNMTCVICMDKPTDLTAATCGHAFCHTCLMEALIAGENTARLAYQPKRSQCPVCRKTINRSRTNEIIPLNIMKRSGRVHTKANAAKRVVNADVEI